MKRTMEEALARKDELLARVHRLLASSSRDATLTALIAAELAEPLFDSDPPEPEELSRVEGDLMRARMGVRNVLSDRQAAAIFHYCDVRERRAALVHQLAYGRKP